MTTVLLIRSYLPWQWHYDSYFFKFITKYHHDSMTVLLLIRSYLPWLWQYDSYISIHTIISTMTMTVWQLYFQISYKLSPWQLFYSYTYIYHDHDSMTVILLICSYQLWQWQYDSFIFKFITNYHHDSMTVISLIRSYLLWPWQYDS